MDGRPAGTQTADRGATQVAPARVLVVDDEESISRLVSTVLRYEGFAVETAASGRDAIAAVTDFAPDLVVLDVMLPDLDGFEVHRRSAVRCRSSS
jgi:two-component system OmpR family response regulator